MTDTPQDAPSVHAHLFALAAWWGAGGLLVELEHLDDTHGLPPVAVDLRRALARFAVAYAPTGSNGYGQAWRVEPCPMCCPACAGGSSDG